jgi:hypothetical protein
MSTTTKNTLTGHGTLTVEHVDDGVVIAQEDGLGNREAVFIPYDRGEQLIAMLQRPAAASGDSRW